MKLWMKYHQVSCVDINTVYRYCSIGISMYRLYINFESCSFRLVTGVCIFMYIKVSNIISIRKHTTTITIIITPTPTSLTISAYYLQGIYPLIIDRSKAAWRSIAIQLKRLLEDIAAGRSLSICDISFGRYVSDYITFY